MADYKMNVDFNNTRRSNFLGHDGFIWWIGVVENRKDPLNLGRCQVRIKGLHSERKTQISTSSLPWAQPIFPVNQSTSTSTTLKEGDMVTGFFLDGDAAQYPVIFGMFHGIPEDAANPNSGFSDPRETTDLQAAPRKPKSITYTGSGSGATITDNTTGNHYPEHINEPTTSRLSRNENIDQTIVASKKSSVVTVSTTNGTWTEPKTPYNAVYPYNHVTETESGHVFEMDDTPGAERLHLYHRSGTFSEFHPDGSKVDKIVKDKYTVVMKDDHLYVMGECSITVQGNSKVYVKKDCTLKVDGSLTETIAKDWTVNVGGKIAITSKGDTTMTSMSNYTISSAGSLILTSTTMTSSAATYSVFATTVDITGVTTTISGATTTIIGSPVTLLYELGP